MVKKISKDTFQDILTEKLALVDFSATWCMPCQMLAPILSEVSEELKDSAAFYNIDVDEQPELAANYSIMSIPALLLFRNGEVVDKRVGFQSKTDLIDFIQKHV